MKAQRVILALLLPPTRLPQLQRVNAMYEGFVKKSLSLQMQPSLCRDETRKEFRKF
jgi:hypothetical protein